MPWKKMSCKEGVRNLLSLKSAFSDLKEDINKFARTGSEPDILRARMRLVASAMDPIYDGLPDVGVSIKKAKEILGEGNVFGAEAYLKAFGTELDLEEIGRVPFTINELRLAQQEGMQLIARYDGNGPAVPSVAHTKLDDLGVRMPVTEQIMLTKHVKNGWTLVSGLRPLEQPLYKNILDSWEYAGLFLGAHLNKADQSEVVHWSERIDDLVKKGDVTAAAGLVNDLVANQFSHGQDYLVSASEAIYDTLILNGGQVKYLNNFSLVSGSVIKTRESNFVPQFAELYLVREMEMNDEDSFEIEVVGISIEEKRGFAMLYQIRV